jgi:hypothetical protein
MALGAAPPAALVGTLNVNKPAFLQIFEGANDDSMDLFISSFAPFGSSTVSRLTLHSHSLSDLKGLKPVPLTSKINWPNSVTQVPAEIFGPGYVAVGSGFLVPGSTTGAVTIVSTETQEQFAIAATKRDYFYHKVLFTDVNGDGRLDAVTARAKKPIFGSSDGEIVWLEQPLQNVKAAWKEHLIAKGPDVHFVLHDFEGDGVAEIISTEFFSKKLSLQWQEQGIWKSKVLDGSIGAAFDLELVDLNGDSHLDLLATNHEGGGSASIFAYEIPADYKNGTWTRHTLLTGIKTEKGGMNQASPGSAFAVQPAPAAPLKKPWIIAGGDGSTKVHRLIPVSDEPGNWSYVEDVMLDSNSTIGQITFGDIDQDGRLELFVPAYDDNKIHIFRL